MRWRFLNGRGMMTVEFGGIARSYPIEDIADLIQSLDARYVAGVIDESD